ncbi:MAG: hypothetical protein WCK53_09890 [Methanomicrobiales archaeon]
MVTPCIGNAGPWDRKTGLVKTRIRRQCRKAGARPQFFSMGGR